MDTDRVHPHDHYDDTVEAHYACLERPCGCLEGWVFVGYIDEESEEREASYPATVARLAHADLRREWGTLPDSSLFPSMLLSRDINNALDV